MHLRSLHLRCFRNYLDQIVDFSAPKTILVGENAQGKSNLLEAVELLSTLRSHRTSRSSDLIQTGATFATVTGQLERALGDVELSLILRQAGKRNASINGETVRRNQDFLGTLNLVEFSCLDLELVRGGPDQRRDWVDGLLIQLEPVYSGIWQQYAQVLKQRNALLKAQQKSLMQRQSLGSTASHPAQSADGDIASQLALWDAQLAVAGTRVIRRRSRVLQRLAPIANYWHQAISGRREELCLHYQPNVPQPQPPQSADDPEAIQQVFLEKIQSRAVAEQFQGSSLVGPHRDDIDFTINQTAAKQYGSQGQQRTLVLALKLAELQLIEEVIQDTPLLLLDDVLAELDLHRQNQLLEAIQTRFQTLITTTHIGVFDAQWLRASQILTVRSGHLSKEIAPAPTSEIF
jgi:DNA replication and repair protein RecF